MAEHMENLATRRSRRSTAGNRMEAALAEMALDEASKDLDDDKEFVNEKDEEDIFESDFASTDEEANQDDLDAGEKSVHDEEKSARKAVRARLEKQAAAAHARHKATFNPQAVAPPVVKPKPKASPAVALDASGQDIPRRAGQKRKSQRRHTVLNTSATDTRAREAGEKKASAPKKFKPTVRSFSQAELIQRALDNEEGNIKEHKNYLKVEEEKRKKARVIKMPAVEGPLLRWISKVEEEKFKVNVEVTPQPQTPAVPSYPNYPQSYYNSYYTQLFQYLAAQSASSSLSPPPQAGSSSQPNAAQTLTSQLVTAPATSPPTSSTHTVTSPPATTPTTATAQTAQAAAPAFSTFRLPAAPSTYPYGLYNANSTTPSGTTPVIGSNFHSSFFTPTTIPVPAQPQQKQYVEEERTEKVAKNFVIHEAGQREGIAKPPWKDTMKAMFGEHVKWEELKVLSGKGRPLGRVKQKCPITGQIAPYLDPRTGVPFADVEAYKVLSDILEHHYIWSPELGCYVGRDEEG